MQKQGNPVKLHENYGKKRGLYKCISAENARQVPVVSAMDLLPREVLLCKWGQKEAETVKPLVASCFTGARCIKDLVWPALWRRSGQDTAAAAQGLKPRGDELLKAAAAPW